ncbi:hypothetical protein BBK14_01830 [Parafrankia soli]|uniref:Uncharacterized protein n=1 Tax=Parafrankia soli TaxID=2599596 RepID=A0A1S1RMT5_9ACTN|nr:hypothetical protein [Parafrankia soli]OHV46612.1 hypothetical protein BBK14_01830 [Parafrankia soli]
MTDPYLAAGRAYCLATYNYDYPCPEGTPSREERIARDAAWAAKRPWLRAAVDAALEAARPREASVVTVNVAGVVDRAAVARAVRDAEAYRRNGRRLS